MIGNSIIRTDLNLNNNNKELGFCNLKKNKVLFNTRKKICFGSLSTGSCGRIRLSLNASSVKSISGDASALALERLKLKSVDGVRLYVGLPLDAVSECNSVNHARAIAAGLKALKLMGVDGVELPIWWGIVEKHTMGKYEWSGYLTIAELVKKMGLKLHVSLCFHANSGKPQISLPDWVSKIGESNPSIYFKDRSGEVYQDCLSLGVDTLPVLDGKSPVQVYEDFCESFKSAFGAYMGSTINGVSMGLGPDGELRYPSRHYSGGRSRGVGEFQCYDEHMLGLLKEHAEARGNPLWGLGGPHDVPSYDQPPTESTFFKDQGGSWETPYGDFFLSWYSNQLIAHGDRVLSLASSAFRNTPVTISGKIPVLHTWVKTNSHPSELTAGFYNTAKRDGYEAVAEMFARNCCRVILPGMDLLDEQQGNELSPQALLGQIKGVCRKGGVKVSGQNLSVVGGPGGFEQIKRNLTSEDNSNGLVDLFTYQRMGASFFSPKHFPLFTSFVRNLNVADLHSDDLPMEVEAAATVSVLQAGTEAEENVLQAV